MDAYRIKGGYPLRGVIQINGSKNAALPCLYASLLTSERVVLSRVPNLRDTRTAVELLKFLGKVCVWEGNTITIQEGKNISRRYAIEAPYELVRQMRASVLSAGPGLSRFGKTRVALPGGCSIGLRPIDIHLKGFEAMGATVKVVRGNLMIAAPQRGLKPAKFRLSFPSVGATENLLMAASLIKGKTVLDNAAREPEIADLARMLALMGAKIQGAGSSRIMIEGVSKLQGVMHEVIPDRIEAGTFALFAACASGSDVRIERCEPSHLRALIEKLQESGISISLGGDWIRIKSPRHFRPKPITVTTKPYPGFPTDLQPLWMTFMTKNKGTALVQETIFEKRFIHAAEMNRMGADIRVVEDNAYIRGRPKLLGAHVMASDIRAGAGLLACALAAQGESLISRIYHLERGYENLEKRLSLIGALVKRFDEVRYRLEIPAS